MTKISKIAIYSIAAAFIVVPLIFLFTTLFISGDTDGNDNNADATPAATTTPTATTAPATIQAGSPTPTPLPNGNTNSEPSPAPTITEGDQEGIPITQSQASDVSVMPQMPDIAYAEPMNISASDENLAAALERLSNEYKCVAVSIAAFDPANGFRTFQHGYANLETAEPVTDETLFRVASLSKLVVAMLAMSLVDSSDLDLDKDVGAYLGFDVRNPHHPNTPITCRMLLQHTASLNDLGPYNSGVISFNSGTLQTILSSSASFANRTPGEGHDYSNLGYVLLAAVCEAVSGKLLDELAFDVIFEPLGITAAFSPFHLKDQHIASQYRDRALTLSGAVAPSAPDPAEVGFQYNSASGNLRITPLDYARIVYILINDGKYDDVSILSEESVRRLGDADFSASDYLQGLCIRYSDIEFPAITYVYDGFDVTVDAQAGVGVYWHTGSAYGTFAQLMYDIQSKKIVVVVTTGGSGAREENGMVESCLAMTALLWRSPAS